MHIFYLLMNNLSRISWYFSNAEVGSHGSQIVAQWIGSMKFKFKCFGLRVTATYGMLLKSIFDKYINKWLWCYEIRQCTFMQIKKYIEISQYNSNIPFFISLDFYFIIQYLFYFKGVLWHQHTQRCSGAVALIWDNHAQLIGK